MGSVNSASLLADAMRAPLEQAVIAVTHPDRERGCLISTGMIACHPDHATLARDAAMRRDAMRERIADSLAAFAPAPVVRWFVRYLAAVMQGMSVQARDGATQAELLEIVADVVIGITARFAIDVRAGVRRTRQVTHCQECGR